MHSKLVILNFIFDIGLLIIFTLFIKLFLKQTKRQPEMPKSIIKKLKF